MTSTTRRANIPTISHRYQYPAGKYRIYTAVSLMFLAAVGLYWATFSHNWLTLPRIVYLIFGISAGLSLGLYETRVVIAKLSHGMEAKTWQISVLVVAGIIVPLLLALALFGSQEYTPFIAYVFPMIPIYLGVSGHYFGKYEDAHRVNVFVSYLGFEYWTQPNPVKTERFIFFVHDLASKDASLFWMHVGYAKIFMNVLETRQDIDESLKQDLQKILKTMNRYRIIGLSCFALFLIFTFGGLGLLFSVGYKVIGWNYTQTANMLMPLLGIMFVGFFVGVFAMIRQYKKSLLKLLETVDVQKLKAI